MKNKSQKIVFRLKYSCLVTTFWRWLDMTNKQISLKNRSARIIHLMKTGCLVKCFELMDKNAREHRAMKAQTLEILHKDKLGRIFQCHRKSAMLWRLLKVWQQRTLGTRQYRAMLDKMSAFVDTTLGRKLFKAWQQVARGRGLSQYVIERNKTWKTPLLLKKAVSEWHFLAALESKRLQIIRILRSRLPRKVLCAWTHSFAWRQCVEARSLRIAKCCASKQRGKYQKFVIYEWRTLTEWYRRSRTLAKFWIFKFLFKWSNYRAKYHFHRTRAAHAENHDAFFQQLRRPTHLGGDYATRSYELASRILGDTSLLAEKNSQSVQEVQALFSRAWLLVHKHSLYDLRPALVYMDARVQAIDLEVKALTEVGITIGSRMRVSWNIKVKKTGKQDALETWVDIWWGCTVLSRSAGHKDKERDPEGNAFWNVIYGELT